MVKPSIELFKLKNNYHTQAAGAYRRGIDFKLSFEDWLKLWKDSGKLHLRGAYKGAYVMARHGDIGCYELGNVSIVPFVKNSKDAWANKGPIIRVKIGNANRGRTPWNRGVPHTAEAKAKMSASHMGKTRKFSEAELQRLKTLNIGRKHTEATKQKLSKLRTGRKHSERTINKMKKARLAYWQKQRTQEAKSIDV